MVPHRPADAARVRQRVHLDRGPRGGLDPGRTLDAKVRVQSNDVRAVPRERARLGHGRTGPCTRARRASQRRVRPKRVAQTSETREEKNDERKSLSCLSCRTARRTPTARPPRNPPRVSLSHSSKPCSPSGDGPEGPKRTARKSELVEAVPAAGGGGGAGAAARDARARGDPRASPRAARASGTKALESRMNSAKAAARRSRRGREGQRRGVALADDETPGRRAPARQKNARELNARLGGASNPRRCGRNRPSSTGETACRRAVVRQRSSKVYCSSRAGVPRGHRPPTCPSVSLPPPRARPARPVRWACPRGTCC